MEFSFVVEIYVHTFSAHVTHLLAHMLLTCMHVCVFADLCCCCFCYSIRVCTHTNVDPFLAFSLIPSNHTEKSGKVKRATGKHCRNGTKPWNFRLFLQYTTIFPRSRRCSRFILQPEDRPPYVGTSEMAQAKPILRPVSSFWVSYSSHNVCPRHLYSSAHSASSLWLLRFIWIGMLAVHFVFDRFISNARPIWTLHSIRSTSIWFAVS